MCHNNKPQYPSKMKNKKILFVAFLIIFGLQIATAQQVDTRNKIEYSQEIEVEDMNTISISDKKVKKTKIEETVSVEDLGRIVNKRRAKRYRKVRNNIGKCFKAEEEEDCNQ